MIKNRVKLSEYFYSLGFKKGAEIGVQSGNYSAQLCKANPDLHLFCIDSWDLIPSRYAGFRERKYQQTLQTLAPYNCTIIKALSMDAVEDFDDNSLDFVYIDANHSFDHIMRDLLEWSKKVKRGGIVSGHDYTNTPRVGVKSAVDAYTKHHKVKLNLTDMDWWFVR